MLNIVYRELYPVISESSNLHLRIRAPLEIPPREPQIIGEEAPLAALEETTALKKTSAWETTFLFGARPLFIKAMWLC